MNLSDGYNASEITHKIRFLQEIRNSKNIRILNKEIQKLADKNGMKVNSVRNLTRFVISSLEFTGWFEKENFRIYGRSTPFLVLTPKGRDAVSAIKASYNIKGSDYMSCLVAG